MTQYFYVSATRRLRVHQDADQHWWATEQQLRVATSEAIGEWIDGKRWSGVEVQDEANDAGTTPQVMLYSVPHRNASMLAELQKIGTVAEAQELFDQWWEKFPTFRDYVERRVVVGEEHSTGR